MIFLYKHYKKGSSNSEPFLCSIRTHEYQLRGHVIGMVTVTAYTIHLSLLTPGGSGQGEVKSGGRLKPIVVVA